MLRVRSYFFLLAALFLWNPEIKAQALSTQLGISTELMVNPFSEEITEGKFGVGLRGRVGFGLNEDLALGMGLGVSSFIFDGSNNAEFIFNPQLSLIIALPGYDRFPYVLGGIGGVLRTGGELSSRSFFAFHLGYGIAIPLSESTFFIESNPSFAIQSEKVSLLFPFRVGVIF